MCKFFISLDNERFPAYYFELFGFDRDRANLRKRVKALDEALSEFAPSRPGRQEARFELAPVKEELKERETEFQTEEQ